MYLWYYICVLVTNFVKEKMYLEHLLLQVEFFFSSLSIYMHISFLRNASVAHNLKHLIIQCLQNYFYKNDNFILILY